MRNAWLIGAILVLQSTPLIAADKLACAVQQTVGFKSDRGRNVWKRYSESRHGKFTLERDAKDPRKFTERVLNDRQGEPCKTFFDNSGRENVFCADKWGHRLQVSLVTKRFTFYRETSYLDGVGPTSDVHLEIGTCTEVK